MKTTTTKLLTVLGALALGMAHWAPAASAQQHVALGQISSTGNVVNSANTVGGVLTSVRDSTGEYTITLAASNAFAGAAHQDFIVEVTCRGTTSSDRVARANIVNPLSPDILTVRVRIDDVEGNVNMWNDPEPANNAFFFSIHRVPGVFAEKSATPHLVSTGRVASDGSLLSGLQLEGLSVSSSNTAVGEYEVTFAKTGAFAGLAHNDFVPILSTGAEGTPARAVRGHIFGINADNVVMRVWTDDVQEYAISGDFDSHPADYPFHFTLYRIPPAPLSGPAKSQAMVALARVGSGGALFGGGTFGGSLDSVRNGIGDYTVTITKPGAFAGRSAGEFVPQVAIRRGTSDDTVISAETEIADASTLLVHVTVVDAEVQGNHLGDPVNRAFYLVVYDAVAEQRPDLQIGNKASLTSHKGDGIYNSAGAGQSIRVRLRDRKNGAPRKKKYFFLAENDGNVVDNLHLRVNKSGRHLKTKYFRITGGRQNVTSALASSGLTLDDVHPGEQIRFRAVAKFKKNAKKKRKNFTHRTHSLYDAGKQDATKARLIRRQR